MTKITVTAILNPLCVSLFLSCQPAYALDLNQHLDPVAVLTLDGDPLTIENYAERKGTAVVFLSARCPATDAALQALIDLHAAYRLRGFLFVGVFTNSSESGREIRDYCQGNGVIFPVYRDPDGTAAKYFGASITPEVFIVDRRGVLKFHTGIRASSASDNQELESSIIAMVEDAPVEAEPISPQGTPIGQAGAKRNMTDRFESISFSSELIFEKIPGAAAHHCSTLAELGNGDLLCAWYGGSYESADDQVLFLARRTKGERSWSEPEVLLRNPAQPPGNAVVFVDAQDRVWVVWGRMESSRPLRRGGGWGNCRLMARVSDDGGHTWTEDRSLDDALQALPRNVPIRRRDGALILPLSGRAEDGSGSFLLTTGDSGKSWRRSDFFAGGSQPTIIERSDGSLLAFMRQSPRITQSVSQDGGQSWSETTPTDLKNPGAGIAMTKLRNGHIILVHNDSSTDRTPLSIRRSLDEGRTWEEPLHLEANPGEYSYPCVIQSADGQIHISYTFRRYAIKHIEMNENWLVHLKRPN